MRDPARYLDRRHVAFEIGGDLLADEHDALLGTGDLSKESARVVVVGDRLALEVDRVEQRRQLGR